MGPAGPAGATGAQGAPGPQGPAGPAGSGSPWEDPFSFAGFTPATYAGNLGGRDGAHAACAAAFPGAHLCHISEYGMTSSGSPIPAGGAWLDPSVAPQDDSLTINAAPRFGRYLGYDCSSWSSASSSGTTLLPNGSVDVYGACATARPLACCNGAPKAIFAGFTGSNAALSGRPSMHAACAAAFPGAHMCHASEYVRAASPASIPAGGAWLDPSVDASDSLTINGAPTFGRYLGYDCGSWSSTSSSGTTLLPNGSFDVYGACATPRPIACCI